jgi:PDZ domain
MRRLSIMILVLLISVIGYGQQLSHRMSNQDVIDMVSLGLSDDLIIDKIRATAESDFDTSLAGLKTLKIGKVSDSVIRAMIHAAINPPVNNAVSGNSSASSRTVDNTGLPREAGVYATVNGARVEIEPEVVNWQTGGVAKSNATLGFVKKDVNGKVMKANSPIHLNTPVEFFIKTLEGTSATEYQLLRLHEKSDRREFRSVTGGVLHQSGGAQRDEVAFQPEKVGERVWRVRIDSLPMGEYGFLAPGTSSVSISASGKMYTFGITDGDRAGTNRSVTLVLPGDSKGDAHTGSSEIVHPQSFSDATLGAFSDANPTVRHDGVTLDRVTSGGSADRAGMRVDDVILAIDNHYLFTGEELNAEIKHYQPGTQVLVRYRRYSTIYEAHLLVGSLR